MIDYPNLNLEANTGLSEALSWQDKTSPQPTMTPPLCTQLHALHSHDSPRVWDHF